MPSKRCSMGLGILLMVVSWGCSGEVPVADKTGPLDTSKRPSEKPAVSQAEFVALKFTDFTPFLVKPEEDQPTWSASEAGIIKTTGTPRGYLYTNKTYDDYTFEGEFRFVPKDEPVDAAAMDNYNTGFLIHVPDEHKTWPRSLEVQGKYIEMGQVKKNARDIEFESMPDDQAAREASRKPVGEWNAIKIVSKNGVVTAYLNGNKISEGESELKSGRIALQAEDYPVEFQNLRIRED